MIIDETKPTQKLSETEHIMMSRFANRFFLDREVDLDAITGILDAARYAGTGANVQPWRVYVTAGTAKLTLTDAISHAHATSAAEHSSEYSYLPDPLPEPFASRRRESVRFSSARSVSRMMIATRVRRILLETAGSSTLRSG
ncbi:nitroreductase [Caballeronia cordobensis]|uniref:Nitroreductase n=2 Tax=Caballeronia cordobensis TaxID=1353886 RepID=A0A158ISU9_CABCO|nr:nitroreductase family protein [Caballeronia cordobensis]SAL59657.1 nitroreductase [Caballeronia cordobensis]